MFHWPKNTTVRRDFFPPLFLFFFLLFLVLMCIFLHSCSRKATFIFFAIIGIISYCLKIFMTITMFLFKKLKFRCKMYRQYPAKKKRKKHPFVLPPRDNHYQFLVHLFLSILYVFLSIILQNYYFNTPAILQFLNYYLCVILFLTVFHCVAPDFVEIIATLGHLSYFEIFFVILTMMHLFNFLKKLYSLWGLAELKQKEKRKNF